MWMTVTRTGLALLLLFLVLIQPNHPQAMTWGALARFPLELPLVLALLLTLGRRPRWSLALRTVLLVILLIAVVLKLADLATFISYNRGFNPLVDWSLVPAAWSLISGAVGTLAAGIAVAGLLAALLALAAGLWWSMRHLAGIELPPAGRTIAALLILPTVVVAVAEIGHAQRHWVLPEAVKASIPGAAFTARYGLERVALVQRTRADLRAFNQATRNDTLLERKPDLGLLGDRDLVLIYIESYGRSSFDNPLYRATHVPTLEGIEQDLGQRGLAMRSAWATAPMVGGQSWLAHGSVASGLWLNTQGRYRAMLASERQTLFHFAQRANRRTVAIKPAHIFPWPEGDFFGFDAIYNAADLGYRGEPFNWVTMPDQFTLHALDRLERGSPDRPPLVVQVALVSSHAPWVPVPELVDWDAIGDGEIFNEMALSGDPPEVVWRDHDRVRDQFRLAIDYSLQVVGAWAARHADNPPLIIALGDHEPARFVSGVDGYDVPMHVIGPPDLVERFAEINWSEGMIPDGELPPHRMDALRDLILGRLSDN